MELTLRERVEILVKVVISSNDQCAWTELYSLLEKPIKSMSTKAEAKYGAFNIDRVDFEEAIQETLIKSVSKYDATVVKEGSFLGYFYSNAKIACLQVLRDSQTGSRKIMADYHSFSATASETNDGDAVSIADAIPSDYNLEAHAVSSVESLSLFQKALNLLKEKDAEVIKIHIAIADKKVRKAALTELYGGAKDATVRKNVQRVRERFQKALMQVGYSL